MNLISHFSRHRKNNALYQLLADVFSRIAYVTVYTFTYGMYGGYSMHMELFVLRIGNIQTVGYSWDFVPISEQVIGTRGWKGVHLCAFVRDSVPVADLPSIASISLSVKVQIRSNLDYTLYISIRLMITK